MFRQHLRDRVPRYETRLKALSGADTASKLMLLFESFCRAGERSLDGLRSRMDAERLGQAVDVLAAARTIYLLGLRRSFPVVSYMAYALGKLAIRNVLVDGVAGLAPEIGSFAEPGDALFAVSYTYASETAALAAQAAERGVAIIAATDSPFSPLAQQATIWFEIVEADVEGFRSLTASFALAATLAVAVAERRRGA